MSSEPPHAIRGTPRSAGRERREGTVAVIFLAGPAGPGARGAGCDPPACARLFTSARVDLSGWTLRPGFDIAPTVSGNDVSDPSRTGLDGAFLTSGWGVPKSDICANRYGAMGSMKCGESLHRACPRVRRVSGWCRRPRTMLPVRLRGCSRSRRSCW